MDVRRLVGQNVQRHRKALKLSQEAFADLTGLHRTYISGVERGVRNPTILILAKIADALQITPDRLLRNDKL